ncbi:hypothetical protein HanIR_Chr16g0795431 [Helianthus annuus]|nr:hypothetical protein HanIR_Chr16g0795431 [Helianthus annuus]
MIRENSVQQKTETGMWFVSVVVVRRVPVRMTGVTGEHRCVPWLLEGIKETCWFVLLAKAFRSDLRDK